MKKQSKSNQKKLKKASKTPKKAPKKVVSKKAVKVTAKPAPKLRGAKKAQDFEIRTLRLMAKGKDRGFITYDEILK